MTFEVAIEPRPETTTAIYLYNQPLGMLIYAKTPESPPHLSMQMSHVSTAFRGWYQRSVTAGKSFLLRMLM